MAANTQTINTKKILGYVLLPGIIPRAKELGTSGFGYLAFLFASVYQAVRILPPNHPFVKPSNIGKFTIAQVMAAAANNIEFSKKNIDQIVVFLALLAAVILMALQFVLVIISLLTNNAFASTGGSPPFQSMFETPSPVNDIAFTMLDYVFGIPAAGGGMGPSLGFFGSSAIPTGPTPFHEGLHALFNFYNLALLVVAVLIFLYYVIVVVIETAQTGIPFGRRFAKIYAPFRLIFAVGLLVPLNYGFNAAQYITLYAAKMGSSFATNGWILYNDALTNPTGTDNPALVARPNVPPIDGLMYFASVYHACREIYWMWSPKNFADPGAGGTCIAPYVIINGQARQFVVDNNAGSCASATGAGGGSYSYDQAKQDFGKSDIAIVLGEYDATEHKNYAGNVRPYCGEITLSLNNDNPAIWSSGGGGGGAPATPEGVRGIEAMYYKTLQSLLLSNDNGSKPFAAFGERVAHAKVPAEVGHDTCHRSGDLQDGSTCQNSWKPPATAFQNTYNNIATSLQAEAMTQYNNYRNNLDLKISDEIKKRGWGGAGIWYNHIADVNGTFTAAIYAAPTIRKFPEVMEFVKQKRLESDRNTAYCQMFEPNLGGQAGMVRFQRTNEDKIAEILNETFTYFNCEAPNQPSGAGAAVSGGGGGAVSATLRTGATTRGRTSNVFIDVVSLIFGLNGLFDVRESSMPDPVSGQPKVHPLAQLSTIGKSLLENSIRSMGMAIGSAFGGGMLQVLSSSLGSALQSASGMFVGIATIGLTAGFLLYYILPFLPFIYFFFAVGSWVKSIFEAMVGVPLWALAHLRIDGDGFSGQAAKGGYFLILEIFLRPIVTLLGLIGGMAVFGAMAVALNLLFDLVVVNITGSTPDPSTSGLTVTDIESLRRGIIDQFFFTIMYAILLYMMATASFKMIDTIPRGFMRWIGSNVSVFRDEKGDPTGHLTSYAAVGGAQISGQIMGGITQGATAAGQGLGAAGRMAQN